MQLTRPMRAHHKDSLPCRGKGGGMQASATQSAVMQPDMNIHLLLQLMDIDVPMQDKKYVDMGDKFVDLGLVGARNVYATPVILLATFGGLGEDGARQIHAYIKERIIPLIDPVQEVKQDINEASKVGATSKVDREVSEDIFETINGKGKGVLRDTVEW